MICLDGWSVSSIYLAIVANYCFQRFLCSLDLLFFSSESLTMLSTSFKMVLRTSVLDLTSRASGLTLRSTRASGKERIQKRSNPSKESGDEALTLAISPYQYELLFLAAKRLSEKVSKVQRSERKHSWFRFPRYESLCTCEYRESQAYILYLN